MKKQITIRTNQQQGGYPGIDQTTAKELAFYKSSMVAGSLVEQIPIPVRAGLNTRLASLNGSLAAATLDQLETVLSEMTLAYPSLRGYSETEALLTVRKYSTELLGLPLWAVQQACRDVSTGAVAGLDLDFPPTCAFGRLGTSGGRAIPSRSPRDRGNSGSPRQPHHRPGIS